MLAHSSEAQSQEMETVKGEQDSPFHRRANKSTTSQDDNAKSSSSKPDNQTSNSKNNANGSDKQTSKQPQTSEQKSSSKNNAENSDSQPSKSTTNNVAKESNNEPSPKQTQLSKSPQKNGAEKSNVQSPQVSEKSTSKQPQNSEQNSSSKNNAENNSKNSDLQPSKSSSKNGAKGSSNEQPLKPTQLSNSSLKNVANNEQPLKSTQPSKSSSKNGAKESNNVLPQKLTQPSKSSSEKVAKESNVKSPQVSEKSTQKNSKDNAKNSDLQPSTSSSKNDAKKSANVQPSKQTQLSTKNVANNMQPSESSSKDGVKETNNVQPKQTQSSKSSPKNGAEKSNVQPPQVPENSTSEQTQIPQKNSKDNTKTPDKISEKPTPTFQKGSSQNNAKESLKPIPTSGKGSSQNDVKTSDKLPLKQIPTQNVAKPSFEKELKQTPTSSQNDDVNQILKSTHTNQKESSKPTSTSGKGSLQNDAKTSDKLPPKPTPTENDAKPSFEKGLKQTPTSSQNDVNQILNPTPDKLPPKPATPIQNDATPSVEQVSAINKKVIPTDHASTTLPSSRTTATDAAAKKPLDKIATLSSSTTIPQKNEANTYMNTKTTNLPGVTPYIDSALTKATASLSIDATNTAHLPDAAAEKTLNKPTTLSPTATRPPQKNDATTPKTAPYIDSYAKTALTKATTSTTASYVDSYAKTALTKAATPTTAPYFDSFAGKTKATISATANIPLDATASPLSITKATTSATANIPLDAAAPMTTTTTHLGEIALVTKSYTLMSSETPSPLYKTATSTTINYGPIFPTIPIIRVSTTAELPTPSITSNPGKITDYQSSTSTAPSVTHKPYIPVITGSLPIAPVATEPAKNTAPSDDNLPSVIVTSTDPSSYTQPDTSRFTVKINLLWPSVVNDSEFPPVLCNVLPNNIADFFGFSPNKINVTQLKRAPDNTCLADMVVATSNGNEIIKTLSNPKSKFYTGVPDDQKLVNSLVNPQFPMALQANSAENAQAADQNFNTSPNSPSGSGSPLGAIVVVAVVGSTLLYAGLTALVVRAYKRSKNRASAIRQDSYDTYSGNP
ncbi:21551_t:CDS:2 [Dentiscutata erythropus]|uniref:21551_t:CDS:1 n=1 Tax=Dentiscutata erythropus TaxID=1348616 RepID=A0A9N9IC99_9GLOM|nr:21551_t:CDS:2 [Dentiscutata erythropus]